MRRIIRAFPLEGMIVVTCLMIAGLLMMVFIRELPVYVIGLFFNFVGVYCWYGYFCNILVKPKKEVLYLIDKNGNKYCFIDSNGKKFYINTEKEYELNKFYLVLKSKDYIGKIIDVSTEVFVIVDGKESYWLNCYLPVGNIEGIFLLPIIYAIALYGLSLIVWRGSIDFSAIIMAVVAIYLIIYDFLYKIKKKNSISGEVDDSNFKKSFGILVNGIKIGTIGLICIVLFYLFFTINGMIGKLFMLPFLLCALCLLLQSIFVSIGKDKLGYIFGKLYVLIFLIYWFGIIGFGMYLSIINKEYSMILFIIPFIIVGVFVVYRTFISKK